MPGTIAPKTAARDLTDPARLAAAEAENSKRIAAFRSALRADGIAPLARSRSIGRDDLATLTAEGTCNGWQRDILRAFTAHCTHLTLHAIGPDGSLYLSLIAGEDHGRFSTNKDTGDRTFTPGSLRPRLLTLHRDRPADRSTAICGIGWKDCGCGADGTLADLYRQAYAAAAADPDRPARKATARKDRKASPAS